MIRAARGMLGSFLGDDGLKARALRSSTLTVLHIGGENVLRLASNLVLTRLLFPEAFGIMVIVNAVLLAVKMFSDFGIHGAIVQNPRGDDPDFLNTAWTLKILRGVLMGGVVLALAHPIAAFYDEPVIAPILTLIALVPVIEGLGSTRLATANRNLVMGRATALMLGAQVFGLVATALLAWWMRSIWALAIGSLFSPVLLAALSHVALPGIANRLRFERDAAMRVLHFGKFTFIATAASFLIAQGDKAVVGKALDFDQLAIYNIGLFIATAPLLFAVALNDRVIFPLYARRPPSASPENRRKLNAARFPLTGGLLAITAVLAVVGVALVEVLYDPRYHGAGLVVTLGALVSMPLIVTVSYEKITVSQGQTGRYALYMVTRAGLQLGLTILGVGTFGLLGVLLAPGLAWLATYPLLVHFARRQAAWDARHDLLFLGLSALIAALVLFGHLDGLDALRGGVAI